jgi:hypothetical protein
MKRFIRIIILGFYALGSFCFGETYILPEKIPSDTAVRDSFTVKLHIKEGQDYEQKFEKIPYVFENCVYLFETDSFGINIIVKDNKIQKVTYQSDLKKADVTFKLTQEVEKDAFKIRLTTKNNSKYTIFSDGLMTIANQRGSFRKSMTPFEPYVENSQAWSLPIVQIVLQNIRLEE